MQKFEVGDKVLVEAEIVDKSEVNLNKYQIDIDCYEYSSYAWVNGKNIHRGDIATKTYEDGMAEAWELLKIISTQYTEKELEEIFGFPYPLKLLELTAQEAAAKIKAWEDAKEIHVGDVVKMTGGEFEGVVSKVKGSGCYVIFGDGSSGRFAKDDLIKTDRKINITGLLAEIGGAENEAD